VVIKCVCKVHKVLVHCVPDRCKGAPKVVYVRECFVEPTRVCVFSYARCGVRTPMNKSVRTKEKVVEKRTQ